MNSLKDLLNQKKISTNVCSSFSDNKLYNSCNYYHKKSIKNFEKKKLKHIDTTQIDTHKIYWNIGQYYDFKKVDNNIYNILYKNGT